MTESAHTTQPQNQEPDRHVTREKIAEGAQEILTFLRANKVRKPSELIQLHRKVAPGKRGLEVQLRPSNAGTNAHTITYGEYPFGNPVEVKINPILGYSTIIVKGTFDPIPGYNAWGEDPFGNTLYAQKFPSTDIATVVSKLEQLANGIKK